MDNSNYTSISSNELIPDEEDISYEIGVRNKRYEATFLQYSENSTYAYFAIRYSDEQLKNPTPEIEAELDTYTKNVTKKMVWFMIQEQFGKYYIIMFYDNKHNQSNGEDL